MPCLDGKGTRAGTALTFEKQGIDRLKTEGFRPKITLEMAALRYLEEKAEKTSLETDIYLLKEMIKICGTLPINEINNETLKVFVNPHTPKRPPKTFWFKSALFNL